MDSFFASLEIKDKPHLTNKPVAVGGKASQRGVLTTCNYVARKYGIHAAMPTKKALELCNDLVVLPVDIEKYRKVSRDIFKIFKCYSKKVEPVSIDEAYLDVTASNYCRGDPEEMAKEIRQCIHQDFGITASAGISSNKLIAKICSNWRKPNGQFSIDDSEIATFIKNVNLKNIPGIGKVNFKKCTSLRMETCKDMYRLSRDELINIFGSYGKTLFDLIRGIDNREIETNKIRKSISVEDTFIDDLVDINSCQNHIKILYKKLINRCKASSIRSSDVKEIFIKIKFNNFETITRQKRCSNINLNQFYDLFDKNIIEMRKPIRLLGTGFNLKIQGDSPQYDIFQ